ncbi:hypothetical protein ACFLWO_02595 [Chloroflexota bacterium]
MERVKLLIAIATALFIKFVVADTIERAILDGFKIAFAQDSNVITFLLLLKIAIAIGGGIWVFRLISKHP